MLSDRKNLKTVFFMLKKRKRTKAALVIVLLLMPPVAYAMYMLTLLLLDTFRGDGLALHQYTYGSRHQLVLQALSDSRQALPLFYAAAMLLWLEVHLLSRFGGWNGVWPVVLAGALTGFVVAAVFVEMTWSIVVPSIVSCLLISLAIAWAVRPSDSSR